MVDVKERLRGVPWLKWAVAVLTVAAFFSCLPGVRAEAAQEVAADSLRRALVPPTALRVQDTENDRGGSVTLTWEASRDDVGEGIACYYVYRSADPDTGFTRVAKVPRGLTTCRDSGLENGAEYYYRLSASDGEAEAFSETAGPVVPRPQWFNKSRLNAMIAVIGFVIAIVYFVSAARGGKELFIRRLAGLDEMDNAVGRATEMGKPILYISGLSSVSDVATIAAINILGEVAKKTAEYNTRLIVPCADPIVMAVEQEVVKQAYAKVGRPDAYNEDDVFYLTRSQFAYVAGVNGIMVRQRPATILYMGMFYAESLVLAETGNSVGSIQIAGTDAVTQLPFFITSCDYTLIGEELYAASAYLSREPVLLGGLKGQDAAKFVIGVVLIIAVVTATLAATGAIKFDFMVPVLTTTGG